MIEACTVRFAGSDWPLVFDLGAFRRIEEAYRSDWHTSGLAGVREAQLKLAQGLIDAVVVFIWAGLQRTWPDMTRAEVLAYLDEATPGELAMLPGQILEGLAAAFGSPAATESGEPWDWDQALAAWVTQWGRPEHEFWASSFATFTSLSNGLSRLFQSRDRSSSTLGKKPEGWSLAELARMNRR